MDIEMVNMLPPPPSGQGQVGLMPPLPPPPNDNSINVNELTPMKFLKKLLLGYLNDIQTQSINIVMGSSSDVSSILDSATELISQIQPGAAMTYTPGASTPISMGSSSSSILDSATELIAQIQPGAAMTYTPGASTSATMGSSSDVSSILDSATELIAQIQPGAAMTYTPTASTSATMGSSSDVSSILDSATELISAISHTSGFTVKQIPEWYEPSDKYINKNVLNINIDKPTFTKELKLDKDATGNTIITVKP